MHPCGLKIIAILLLASVASACDVTVPNGVFKCLSDSECPGEMTCWDVTDHCYHSVPECQPRSCEDALAEFAEFGITCGIFNDNCGGNIECNLEECDCADVYEPNNTLEEARTICPQTASAGGAPPENCNFGGGFDVTFGPNEAVVLNFDAPDDEDWFAFPLRGGIVQAQVGTADGLASLVVTVVCADGGTLVEFDCFEGGIVDLGGFPLCVGTDEEPNPAVFAECLGNFTSEVQAFVLVSASPTNYEPMCQEYAGRIIVESGSTDPGDVLPFE